MNMHKSNAINQVHELAPPTCVLLLSKIFDSPLFFNVAPSWSMSMLALSSPLYLFEQIFHIFVQISMFCSSPNLKLADCPPPSSGPSAGLFPAKPTIGKTLITFSSELRFQWFWTFWKAYSESYTTHMNTWSKAQWIKAVFYSKSHPSVRRTPKHLFFLPQVDQHQLQHLLLCKCANTTKCTPPCTCLLAFSQIFFKEFSLALTAPLNPNTLRSYIAPSGTRWPICK